MQLFGSSTPNDPHAFESPVDRLLKAEKNQPLFGPLEPQDTEWAQHGGFVTETQSWYATLPNGQTIMFQIIHSGVGLWSPVVQMTFAHFTGKDRIWKSVNVSGFKTAPGASLDKRSCKCDHFSVTLDPKNPDRYEIQAQYDADTQLSWTVTRAPGVPGYKLGTGPRGGLSYFGTVKPAPSSSSSSNGYMPDRDAGADGYVAHRFWPRASVSGIVRLGKDTIDMDNSTGMFVHAVQGRRPNLVASRWNFADFQSNANNGDGQDNVSLIMMEFTTTEQHKHRKVNVGSVIVDDKLVAVTMGGSDCPEGNKAEHQELTMDKDTGYNVPKQLSYQWSGPAIADRLKTVKAHIQQDASKGLAEKVDVLAEIPFFIKKVVNVVSGAKPYIYQWSNTIKATIELPELDGKPARTVEVSGQLFTEASYVSEDP